MTSGVITCLALIIIVLTMLLVKIQSALVAVTRNQQKLYVCFRALLKSTCSDDEKAVLSTIEHIINTPK